MTFLQKFNQKVTDMVDVEKIRIGLIEHVPHLSAETMGWLAVILLHLATIPTLVAMLTGLTEKLPPVDMVLFSWVGQLIVASQPGWFASLSACCSLGQHLVSWSIVAASLWLSSNLPTSFSLYVNFL